MDRFDFFADEIADQSFFWTILIGNFDSAVTKMAVGASRRRRWASFEEDMAALKLNGRLIFWALVGRLLG